jgi:hypothetical protein
VPDFIASVLIPDDDGGFRVPGAWAEDLDGLPGFDRTTGVVRLAHQPEHTRDPQGRPLMYPGRSHPLTRRTIASVRTGRVSAARGKTLSLLLTYVVEAGTGVRKVFALRLTPDGRTEEQSDILPLPDDAVSPGGIWQLRFSDWAPGAVIAAGLHAATIAERIGSTAAVAYRDRLDRDAAVAHVWLVRRANELCGTVSRSTGDLFEPEPSESDWRSCAIPEQRLAAFAADPSMPVPQRRDAADALVRVKMERMPFPRPVVRTLGMLMLVP